METQATASPSLMRRAVTLDWREHQLWMLPAALTFIWLSVFAFILPYDFDESVFTITSTGITDGHWPYRDLFDNKPPLIYVWYFPAALTGSTETQRIFGSLLSVMSIGVFASIARRWLAATTIKFSVWAYAMLLANPFMYVGASIETFMLLPLLGAIAAPSALLAGALLGVAVMTKPVALFFLPILIVQWRWSAWRVAMGAGLVCSVVVLSFAPIWRDLWTANVTFNREFTSFGADEYSLGQRLWQLLGGELVVPLAVLPLWLAALAGIVRVRRGVILLWAVCGLLALKANGYTTGSEFRHYYTLLVPAVALLAGVGLDHTLQRRSLRVVYCLTALFSVAVIGAAVVRVFDIPPKEERALITAVRKTDGELYVLGASPNFYRLADRQPQRRFYFTLPMIVRPEWGESTRRDLTSCPPDVLVTKVRTKANRDTFDVPWAGEIEALYTTRREFGDLALLTNPIRPCDR